MLIGTPSGLIGTPPHLKVKLLTNRLIVVGARDAFVSKKLLPLVISQVPTYHSVIATFPILFLSFGFTFDYSLGGVLHNLCFARIYEV